MDCLFTYHTLARCESLWQLLKRFTVDETKTGRAPLVRSQSDVVGIMRREGLAESSQLTQGGMEAPTFKAATRAIPTVSASLECQSLWLETEAD